MCPALDVVEVPEQLLRGEVGGEGLDVEAVGQLAGEGRVVGLVDELEEVGEVFEVLVVARFQVEHLLVGLGVVAPIGEVARALGLVERAAGAEALVDPEVVGG